MELPKVLNDVSILVTISGLSVVGIVRLLMKRWSYRPKLLIRPANEIGQPMKVDRLPCWCNPDGKGYGYLGISNGHKKTISVDEMKIHFASPISLVSLGDAYFESLISDVGSFEHCLRLAEPVRIPSMMQWNFAIGVAIPRHIQRRQIRVDLITTAHWVGGGSILKSSLSRHTSFVLEVYAVSELPELVTEMPYVAFMTQDVMTTARVERTRSGVAAYRIRDPDGHIRVTLDPTSK